MTSRIIRSAYGGAREAARLRAIHEQETPTNERAEWDNERTTEGDSVVAIESRRLDAWDHPPASGHSRSSRVIR